MLSSKCPIHAEAITRWLQQHQGSLPQSLALNGKFIGNGKCGMIITLCRVEDVEDGRLSF